MGVYPYLFFNERPRWSGYRWTGSEGELGGVERESVNQNLLCKKIYIFNEKIRND